MALTSAEASAPRSATTMPSTASPAPSRVTAPYRVTPSMRTWATSPRRTGAVPLAPARRIRRDKSSKVWIAPSARTISVSSPASRRPAPSLRLLRPIAVMTSEKLRPAAESRARSGTTAKLLASPPSTLTSATPGSVRRAGRSVQSSRARRSLNVRPPPSMVNMNTSDSGVEIGASPPLTPSGRLPETPA